MGINFAQLKNKIGNGSTSAPVQTINTSAPAQTIAEKLNLKKGIIAEQSNITIDKINRIESIERKIDDILKRMDGIHSALGKHYEIISSMNTELIPSILSGLKTLNDLQIENNTLCVSTIKNAQQTSAPAQTIVTRKPAQTSAPAQTSTTNQTDIERLYQLFMSHFKGNFAGTRELNQLDKFTEFIALIDENDLQTSFKRANAKYFIARKSSAAGLQAISQAIDDFSNGTAPAPQAAPAQTISAPAPAPQTSTSANKGSFTLSKESFCKSLNIPPDDIDEIIASWKTGTDSEENRNAMKSFIRDNYKPAPFLYWGKFFNWINLF